MRLTEETKSKTNPKRLIEKDLEKYPKYKDFCKRSIKMTILNLLEHG